MSHMIVSWYERENRKVVVRKPRVAAQIRRGVAGLFQKVALETGNARLPTVERRTGGTSDDVM